MRRRSKFTLITSLIGTVTSSVLAMSAHAVISCSISLPDIDFGAVNATENRVRVNPQLSVSCSGGAANGNLGYTVHLNYSGVMLGSGGGAIPYGLFKDGARTLPWGVSGMSDVLSFSAAGVSRPNASSRMTIYAEVLGSNFHDVAPGVYSDTVVVVLEY